MKIVLLGAACLLFAAGCSKNIGSGSEESGMTDECLQSNIIYNGNISLYSFDRWPEDAPENDNIRKEIIRTLNCLGGIGSREAVWSSYGSVKPVSFGEDFDFSYNDEVIGELQSAGLGYCLQMKVDALAANPDDYGEQWERNARWYVSMIARRYGDAPLYYIPMNEPDNQGQRTGDTPALTTEQIIRVQKVVYETLKSYNPDIKVASSPLCLLQNTVEFDYTSSGRDVLMAGITRYCDYFAFHKHVDIGEDGRYSETDLWDLMDEAEQAGYPRRPAIVNENGTYLTLDIVFPEATEQQQRLYKAYWIGNDLIQMKSLGLKYIVVYSLAGSLSQNGEYNIMDVETKVGSGYLIHEQEYNSYRDLWNPSAHALSKGINGGFEADNPDKSRGWVVSFRGRSFTGIGRVEPKEWDYVSIVDAGARSGSRCLEMSPIDFVPGASVYDKGGISANRCRRLVEGCVPGRSYRVSAWVRLVPDTSESVDDAPAVTLRAMGFDPTGKARAEASVDYADSKGEYVQTEVVFRAENPWVVISLEHNGKGYAFWDDVSIAAM